MTEERLRKLRIAAERAASFPWWLEEIQEELGKAQSPIRDYLDAACPVLVLEMIFEIETLRMENEKLDSQANWLAGRLAAAGASLGDRTQREWRACARVSLAAEGA